MSWTSVIGIVLLLIFPILWKNSHKFRYYTKLLYYNTIVTIVSGICILPIALRNPKSVENLKPIAWSWKRLFVDAPILGLNYELRNGEHLVSDKPCVIVCNHQSSLDVIAAIAFLPERCSFLAKKSLMYAGSFGFGAWLCGIVFIDRSNHHKAKETLKDAIERVQNENIKLWVYPEGTRRMGDEVFPFKKGAFNIAVEAQIPVVPVVLSSYKNFYDKKRKIFENGKIIMQCLPPVSTEGLTSENVTDLTNNVRDQMNQVFQDISKEVPIGREFSRIISSVK